MTWNPVADLKGDTGATGPQGVKGDTGDTGATGPAGTTDHGLLTGLGDDDHTQYHNNTRGDARYIPLADKDVSNGIPVLTGTVLPRKYQQYANTTQDGTIVLAGDLGGTGPSPTVPALAGKPIGIMNYYERATNSAGSSGTPVRVCYTWCNMVANRLYWVSAPNLGVWSTAYGRAEIRIRYTTNNTVPTASSTQLTQGSVELANASSVEVVSLGRLFKPTVNITGFVVAIFVARQSGTATVQSYGASDWPASIMIEDMGSTFANVGAD